MNSKKKKTYERKKNYKPFIFSLTKIYQKNLFLFSPEGIKSPKISDHDGKTQNQVLYQRCKGLHKHEISFSNTKLDVAEL